MPHAPHSGDWLSLLGLTVLWGSAFLLNELALAAFTPSWLVAGRIAIAAIVLLIVMQANGIQLPAPGRAWWPMLVLAVFGNVLPFLLIAWAQQHIDSALAGTLMAVMPLFVLTLAHFLIPGGKLTGFRVLGFAAGFVGVVVIIGPDFVRGLHGNLALLGAIATLGAALSYAVSSIYARRVGTTDPLRLAVGMLLIASMLSMPGAVVEGPPVAMPGVTAVAALVLLGLLSTGFATLLYFRIVQGPGPAFLSFVNYLVPAWAVIVGAVFLDENLSHETYAGLALILAGIACSELGPRAVRAVRARLSRAASSQLAAAAHDVDRV